MPSRLADDPSRELSRSYLDTDRIAHGEQPPQLSPRSAALPSPPPPPADDDTRFYNDREAWQRREKEDREEARRHAAQQAEAATATQHSSWAQASVQWAQKEATETGAAVLSYTARGVREGERQMHWYLMLLAWLCDSQRCLLTMMRCLCCCAAADINVLPLRAAREHRRTDAPARGVHARAGLHGARDDDFPVVFVLAISSPSLDATVAGGGLHGTVGAQHSRLRGGRGQALSGALAQRISRLGTHASAGP